MLFEPKEKFTLGLWAFVSTWFVNMESREVTDILLFASGCFPQQLKTAKKISRIKSFPNLDNFLDWLEHS